MAKSLPAALLAALCALAAAGPAWGKPEDARPSVAASFPIGTSGPACVAQGVAMGTQRHSVFERKWVILCSDVSGPVGTAFALRKGTDADARMAAGRREELDCNRPESATIANAGTASVTTCRGRESGAEWRQYAVRKGKTLYAVEGLGGYDSVLRLALANLVADRIVEGEVSIATLGAPDTLAIAKATRAVSDVETLIGQGYRSNNAGSYAEAAELFAAPPVASEGENRTGPGTSAAQQHELMINRALQLSNLGAFDQAARLFGQARELAGNDPLQSRLARNYEAADAINRGDLDAAIAVLDRPVPLSIAPVTAADSSIRIDRYTAAGLNAPGNDAAMAILERESHLSTAERIMIVDAQAMQLRGTVMRLRGETREARAALEEAYRSAMRVRGGKVTSIARLLSQILSETALTHEDAGSYGEAEALLRQSLAIVQARYPDSASVNTATARLAGFLARRGKRDEALNLFRGIVGRVSQGQDSLVGMENLLRPYFDLLTGNGKAKAEDVAELFLASQLVERPGAADTMAQLSRELEGGSDAASTAFRQSLLLGRELESNRIRIARLNELAATTGTARPEIPALLERQKQLLDAQLKVMSGLAAYPQYRAVAHRYVSLEELRMTLRPGEGYLKLVQLSGSIYAVFISPEIAQGWRLAIDSGQLADDVAILRESISLTLNGVQSTYPFEVDTALALHKALLGPAAGAVAGLHHLIFEPDGAMLQLPLNLLTGDAAGVAAYHARVERGGDEYDFTGIDWLGRNRTVSTALSATSFRDARAAPASKAPESFLGLGRNQAPSPAAYRSSLRGAGGDSESAGCGWPISAWERPISDAELRDAAALFGQVRSELLTGPAFTDEAVVNLADLDRYRIVHFATHGLVTAPRDGCPVQPSLLTSFGGPESDGLLSFTDIFNLRIDADLVVLSACDTAGQAGIDVTREAGVTSGGGQELDGLVRAFIAAGGRQVIASHWPAPDDFDATRRLFTGFYRAAGTSMGDALIDAQRALMDDPLTSHPFYWAGFALIGDGGRPVPGR